MIAKYKSKINGGLSDLTEIYIYNKNKLSVLHKTRIAKWGVLWYIVITKKKEVSPKYYSV